MKEELKEEIKEVKEEMRANYRISTQYEIIGFQLNMNFECIHFLFFICGS